MPLRLSTLRNLRLPILPWAILAFAALNVIFLGGKRRAFGGFVAVLRKDFRNISLSELNWIGDSYSALAYMSCGLSTMAIISCERRYGLFQMLGSVAILLSCLTSSVVPNPHWLFLTHTVFHGVGSSLILSTVGLIVNEHFNCDHPYHIMATTLVSGGSLAAILFVSFFAYLIEQYGWRMAFVILGVVYFCVNSSAVPFFRKKEGGPGKEEVTTMGAWGSIRYWQVPLMVLWFLERVLTSTVTYGLLLNLTDYVFRSESSLVRSTILTTMFAAGEGSTYLVGTILTALTKDFFKDRLGLVLLATSTVTCFTLMTLEFNKHMETFSKVLCFICGFSLGPSNTFLFPAGEELTRLPGQMAYPFSLAGMGFGMIISPLLTAKVAEIFLYRWFFLVQGCLILVKVIVLVSILALLFTYKRHGLLDQWQPLSPSTEDFQAGPLTKDERSQLLEK